LLLRTWAGAGITLAEMSRLIRSSLSAILDAAAADAGAHLAQRRASGQRAVELPEQTGADTDAEVDVRAGAGKMVLAVPGGSTGGVQAWGGRMLEERDYFEWELALLMGLEERLHAVASHHAPFPLCTSVRSSTSVDSQVVALRKSGEGSGRAQDGSCPLAAESRAGRETSRAKARVVEEVGPCDAMAETHCCGGGADGAAYHSGKELEQYHGSGGSGTADTGYDDGFPAVEKGERTPQRRQGFSGEAEAPDTESENRSVPTDSGIEQLLRRTQKPWRPRWAHGMEQQGTESDRGRDRAESDPVEVT
jgi:hypothetical protein